jgi:hypothetical protein
MRKFLMVAALVAVAACGKKQGDTGSMEATGAAAGAAIDTAAHKADSTMGAMADSAHAAVDTSKTAVQKAADALSAPADSVNKKMEKNPATPPKN